MRLSAQDYQAAAAALHAEARTGISAAEQERLAATAQLAKRMAELKYENRNNRLKQHSAGKH